MNSGRAKEVAQSSLGDLHTTENSVWRLCKAYVSMISSVIKLAVSLALLTILFLRMDTEALLRNLAGVDPFMFLGAICLIFVAICLRAYRWSAMMSAYNVKLSFRKSFELIQMGNFYGQFLPMTVGGDMVRIWQGHRDGLPLKAAMHTVLLDRWFGFASLIVIVLISSSTLSGVLAIILPKGLLVMLALLLIGGLLLVLVLDKALKYLPTNRTICEISGFSDAARRFVTSATYSLPVFAASLAIHLISIAAIKIIADGVGAPVPFMQLLMLMPPVLLMTLLPISFAGWGVREGAMVFLLGLVGVSPEQALAISILIGCVYLFVSFSEGFRIFSSMLNYKREV